ncbi:hypothetical protein [Alkalimarinus sediminis]|uniref:Uncharacterized protein n=1 Tax=Alkalimarinus sediminis TaxID=1632866 RepID=A0A9E8KP95_9ALTE|nr:hypothetical protein [Alkalimarinus sediminis]UZW74524.1 hypothetical protein NNL22_16095 [Alkalimarinus sediminis]
MKTNKTEEFNAFTTDWKNRIEKLFNTVIILSGGVMSITIGAYINNAPPKLSHAGITIIQLSWYLLSSSLIASLLVHFSLVISGAIVLKSWESRFNSSQKETTLIDSPVWVHWTSWVLGVWAVLSCIFGLGFIAYGASQLLGHT